MREQKDFDRPDIAVNRDSHKPEGVTENNDFDSLTAERTRYGRFNVPEQGIDASSDRYWSSAERYAAALGISDALLAELLFDPDRASSPHINAQLAHRIFREEIAPAAIAALMGICGKIISRGRSGDDLVTLTPEAKRGAELKFEGLQIKLVPSHGSLLKRNGMGYHARVKAAAALKPGGDTRLLLIPVNVSRSELKLLFIDLADKGADPGKISVIHPQILRLAGSPLFINKSKLRGPPENLHRLNIFMQACAKAKGSEAPPFIPSLPTPENAAIKSTARIISRSIGFQEQLLKAAFR